MTMIKEFVFDYDFGKAEACFRIDTNKFTKDKALATLNFYTWDWDKEADLVEEVVKKYAIEAIRQATINDHNTLGVKHDFENLEGFGNIDGSIGIELTHVEGLEFDEDEMTCSLSQENRG